MTKKKTPFFFTFKGLSTSPIFQYLNFSFHRHFKQKELKEVHPLSMCKGIGRFSQDSFVVLRYRVDCF